MGNVEPKLIAYDADHERRRKEQLIKLYDRTPEQVSIKYLFVKLFKYFKEIYFFCSLFMMSNVHIYIVRIIFKILD